MPVAMLLATLLVAAPPTAPANERHLYEFRLFDQPVGYVQLELKGTEYRYRSVHLYNRGGEKSRTVREEQFTLNAELQNLSQQMPASLALTKAKPGCVRVVDELTRKVGWACLDEEEVGAGTVLKQPVRITRGTDGLAREIRFPQQSSAFIRVKQEAGLSPPDLTGEGFKVEGKGRLGASPAVKLKRPALEEWTVEAARALSADVHQRELPFCVDYAAEFVRRANAGGVSRAAFVHGVRVEALRAMPHAWVAVKTKAGWLELDPTLGADASEELYLPLSYPKSLGESGKVWLSLMRGERKIVRR